MNLFQAELKYYLRSPIIWVILALSAFISAWSFLLSVEIFTTLQVKFVGMSDAPTIANGIIYPLIGAQSKILIIIVSIIGGLSFARYSETISSHLISNSQLSASQVIKHKFMALLLISFLFIFPTIAAIVSLVFMTKIHIFTISVAILGLLLLMIWMLALALLISSFVKNTGFSILLCIVVFLGLLLLSQSSFDNSWGKNWIQVFSPFYHFKQFTNDYVPYSSLMYFIVGSLLSLWLAKIRFVHNRYML